MSTIDLSSDLQPHEIALLQFDTRSLARPSYWRTAYTYNAAYCKLHGHQYLYFSLSESSTCNIHGNELASPWCKVRAMLQADADFPGIRLFIYMDSDAVIDRANFNTSINGLLGTMQRRLPTWDPHIKPMVFNQDGPCWWCRLVAKVGYTTCLNAGTVLWFRSPHSTHVLQRWWDAALDSYESNPIKRRFRLKWPWEQDRQEAVFHNDSTHIQVASHPDHSHMPENAGRFDGWCLSHLPGSGCFISHFCANKSSKKKMMREYDTYSAAAQSSQLEPSPLTVSYLRVEPFDMTPPQTSH
jgi:hypothetical protein